MKHALALILACCALVAQDKPNSDDPGEILRRAALGLESPAPSGKPAAATPKPAAVEKTAKSKPKIAPIDVGDELIELIHQLKKEARSLPSQPSMGGSNPQASAAMYDAELRAKTEAQRLLLQALIELAKEAAKPTAVQVHSSSFEGTP
jgi:hypothetical protein